MLQRLKSVPGSAGRKLSHLAIRLVQATVLAGTVAGLLIVLDAILLPDDPDQ